MFCVKISRLSVFDDAVNGVAVGNVVQVDVARCVVGGVANGGVVVVGQDSS